MKIWFQLAGCTRRANALIENVLDQAVGVERLGDRCAPRVSGPLIYLLIGGFTALLRAQVGQPSAAAIVVAGFVGAGVVWLVSRRRAESRKRNTLLEAESQLPNVLERVVMAVTAGIDVIPACTLVARDRHSQNAVQTALQQAVTAAERGVSFSEALEKVGAEADSPAIRHAFIHLGLAQRQGGELVRPLRELADATLLGYQERIEEEIAKLPVRATLPLLLTFAGLIILFITVPLVQVGQVVAKVAKEGQP
jgi:Flp pilus assembly protein TadB